MTTTRTLTALALVALAGCLIASGCWLASVPASALASLCVFAGISDDE